MNSPRQLDVFLDVSNFASQPQSIRQVKLAGSAEVALLLPALVRELPLPVVRNGVPLIYHICLDEKRLDPNLSLTVQGVVNGCILTIEVEYPSETPLTARIRNAGVGNVRWHCFVSHEPCVFDAVKWDPTLVSVFLSPEYSKSDHIWNYTILLAISGIGLSASRIQVVAMQTRDKINEVSPDRQGDATSQCPAAARGHEQLFVLCRAAQQGLLSVVDLTGAAPFVFLALGMLWGVGQPAIVMHKNGAFVPLPMPDGQLIRYREPGDNDSIRQIRLAIQQRTGIADRETEACYVCKERFASKERMIVCVACRARYHTYDWPQRCEKCGDERYICL